jgi:hypothetical protein
LPRSRRRTGIDDAATAKFREHKTAGILYRLEKAPASGRALILGAFAVISALLSVYVPSPLFIHNTPPLPALWFGIVLCAGVALWALRNPLRILFVLLACLVAWQAAVETTSSLYDSMAHQITAPNTAGVNALNFGFPGVDYLWGLCGMVGGMVGSGIVVLAIAAVLKGFRTPHYWASPILFGTIAGFFLECGQDPTAGGLFIHIGSMLPLFLLWQIAVAASIGYNLTKPAGRG